MDEQVKAYLAQYPEQIAQLFMTLRALVYESVSVDVTEKLWARLPSYYVGNDFVRLIPFKNHINVEARAVLQHSGELTGYKITPKGMLQLDVKQDVPRELLLSIFADTLEKP